MPPTWDPQLVHAQGGCQHRHGSKASPRGKCPQLLTTCRKQQQHLPSPLLSSLLSSLPPPIASFRLWAHAPPLPSGLQPFSVEFLGHRGTTHPCCCPTRWGSFSCHLEHTKTKHSLHILYRTACPTVTTAHADLHALRHVLFLKDAKNAILLAFSPPSPLKAFKTGASPWCFGFFNASG